MCAILWGALLQKNHEAVAERNDFQDAGALPAQSFLSRSTVRELRNVLNSVRPWDRRAIILENSQLILTVSEQTAHSLELRAVVVARELLSSKAAAEIKQLLQQLPALQIVSRPAGKQLTDGAELLRAGMQQLSYIMLNSTRRKEVVFGRFQRTVSA